MKATGIVRRIDELGRVVIPKEIRRTMRIREGDPLEIFTNRDGELILKKYSPLEEIEDIASYTAEAITSQIGHICLICDRDRIICAAGGKGTEFIDRSISSSLDKLIEQRKTTVLTGNTTLSLFKQEDRIFPSLMVFPIINRSDCHGAIIVINTDPVAFTPTEQKVCEAVCDLMGRQLE